MICTGKEIKIYIFFLLSNFFNTSMHVHECILEKGQQGAEKSVMCLLLQVYVYAWCTCY